MKRLLLTLMFLCVCVCSHMQEGEGEVKGASYTPEEEALKHQFDHLFREKRVPVLEDVREFLSTHGWIKRSETSIRDKCRNIVRRQLE